MSTELKRLFAVSWWGLLYGSVRNLPWAAVAFFMIIASLVYALLVVINPDASFEVDSLIPIIASLLGSIVFFVFAELWLSFRKANNDVFRMYHDTLFEKFGICSVNSQRGYEDAVRDYDALISKATRRIWAVGITNNRLTNQYSQIMVNKLRRHSIEILIAFLDNDAAVCRTNDPSNSRRSADIIDTLPTVHHRLEKGMIKNGVYGEAGSQIMGNIEKLEEMFKSIPRQEMIGSVSIYKIISVTYFSCFVIDDQLFFFPMLTRNDSGQDPMIKVSTKEHLGRAIIECLERMFNFPPYTRRVYHRSSERDTTS